MKLRDDIGMYVQCDDIEKLQTFEDEMFDIMMKVGANTEDAELFVAQFKTVWAEFYSFLYEED